MSNSSRPAPTSPPSDAQPRRPGVLETLMVSHSKRWLALALLCLTGFMIILDASIVLVAVPSIERELTFSTGGVQWVPSAYALMFGGLLLLGGRISDLLGRRRVFMTGLL